MLTVICIEKIEVNNIIYYCKIEDTRTKETRVVTVEELFRAIKQNKCKCLNAKIVNGKLQIRDKQELDNKVSGEVKLQNIEKYKAYLHKCKVLGHKCTPIECRVIKGRDEVILTKINNTPNNVVVIPTFITGIVPYDEEKIFADFEPRDELKVINLSKQIKSMRGMFTGIRVQKLDLSEFDTTGVTDMASMFSFSDMKTLILGDTFVTDNVTNMQEMFEACMFLKSLDITNFNTSKVLSMSSMFEQCMHLKSIKVNPEKFDTRNVVDFKAMYANCVRLKDVHANLLKLDSAMFMQGMFSNCRSITNVDLSSQNADNVTNINSIFSMCTSLETVLLPKTTHRTFIEMQSAFKGSGVRVVDISGFDLRDITSGTNFIFANCDNLDTLILNDDYIAENLYYSCTLLNLLITRMKVSLGDMKSEIPGIKLVIRTKLIEKSKRKEVADVIKSKCNGVKTKFREIVFE